MTNHIPLIPVRRRDQGSTQTPAQVGSRGPKTAPENLAQHSPLQGNGRVERLVAVICLALALGYLVILAASLFTGHWLLDAQSRPIANDFVNVYAAGRLTADGHPALAYDWTIHK